MRFGRSVFIQYNKTEENGSFSPGVLKSYQINAGTCTIDHQEAPRLQRCGVSGPPVLWAKTEAPELVPKGLEK